MSFLLKEFKRLISKHSDKISEHKKDKDNFKEYEDKINNRRYNDSDSLKDDHYEIATLLQNFVLEYNFSHN